MGLSVENCCFQAKFSKNQQSSEFGWGVGRSEATGLYLGGHLAGAERLACILVSHCGGIRTLTPRLFGNSPIRY